MISIEICPVAGIGEIAAGEILAAVLAEALAPLAPRQGDLLVVTQKVVSKAEGRFVLLADVKPGARAMELAQITEKDPRLVELALSEASEVVRAAPRVLILRHRLGFVLANAGVDQSNMGPGDEERALLLPHDPDASARRLREELAWRLGVQLGVVVSDSFGRPWRNGVVNVAIGAAGLPSLHDSRGERDRDGRDLRVTQIAYADLLASAAGLAMGEAGEGVPAALVRGLRLPPGDAPASMLVRPAAEDLFR